jgi:2-polyprenyl-3-methyl-5-hydroxy-6-metoxy-1,4-benzoquinol methylase
MTSLDRFLQRWRIKKVRPFLRAGDRVLDIGSVDGVMFDQIPNLSPKCFGIDPTLKSPISTPKYELVPGFFPRDMPSKDKFDAITMLAVLEHFPTSGHGSLAAGCANYLRAGGRLIITVPSPAVDHILKVLTALRLIHGMSLEEHHGYAVSDTQKIFSPPAFELLKHERFQLGLNNLFVFERK